VCPISSHPRSARRVRGADSTALSRDAAASPDVQSIRLVAPPSALPRQDQPASLVPPYRYPARVEMLDQLRVTVRDNIIPIFSITFITKRHAPCRNMVTIVALGSKFEPFMA